VVAEGWFLGGDDGDVQFELCIQAVPIGGRTPDERSPRYTRWVAGQAVGQSEAVARRQCAMGTATF